MPALNVPCDRCGKPAFSGHYRGKNTPEVQKALGAFMESIYAEEGFDPPLCEVCKGGAVVKLKVELTDWVVRPGRRLEGKTAGHPCFLDGDLITTSTVIGVSVVKERVVAETRNTFYVLSKNEVQEGLLSALVGGPK